MIAKVIKLNFSSHLPLLIDGGIIRTAGIFNKKIFMFVFHKIPDLIMSQSTFKNILSIILVCSLIASCAKVSSPTGGPKDKIPPEVVGSNPVNGATFYNNRKFEVTFNEYVTLDRINENLIVSPPLEKRPLVSLRGKSVVVEYEDELKENTTYTFNFYDAIKDLNEGNVYNNFRFVFSTGPVIDSLSVTGNLFNAYVLDIPEDALVMLYSNLEDSAFKKNIPDYLSKVDETGYFRIDNVREGTYNLYGLKETDNSKNFNLREEEIAFLDEPVTVTSEKNYLPVKEDTTTVVVQPGKKAPPKPALTGEYKLILFGHDKKLNYLTTSSRDLPYLLFYTLALPPGEHSFDLTIPGADENSYFKEKSPGKDTLKVWLTDSTLYSQQQITTIVGYPYTDTTNTIIHRTDTLDMRYTAPRSARAGRVRPTPFTVQTNLSGSLRPGQKIFFQSINPLRTPDTSLIRFYEQTKDTIIQIPYSFIPDSTNSCRTSLNIQLEPGKNYLYIADSASFGNIYGENSDSTGMKFSVRKETSFGTLVLNIKGYDGKSIIELLDNNEKVIRKAKMDGNGKTEFSLLDKGKYKLRVIYDINDDGRWTTGDLAERRQPEPVSFYPRELEIKEDWVVDQDWDISNMNFKELINVSRSGTGR
jgi:hypothetical protein